MLDRPTIERARAVSGDAQIVIALSGGSDSTALLHLLAEEVGAGGLHAVIIDHALRAGSAADAARAASFAEALGVRAEVIRIDWDQYGPPAPSPATTGAGRRGAGGPYLRSQQTARAARYAALCDAARRVGACVIATGHTRDDQAETVLLRAERGSGWRGLAGMRTFAPAPLWPEGRGLWLARPLLGARRSELREYLKERGADWIDDPANANEAYARVRARRTLAALESAGLDPMRLAALAERLSPRAEALDAQAEALIQIAVRFQDDLIFIKRDAWRGEDVRQRALAVLVAAAGGAARAPGEEQTAALRAQMDSSGFKAATLAGAVAARVKDGWRLSRELGALTGRADGAPPLAPLPLPAACAAVWDRRLELRCLEPGWSAVVDDGVPVLARGDERRPITEASPCWLLEDRVRHLLGGRANASANATGADTVTPQT